MISLSQKCKILQLWLLNCSVTKMLILNFVCKLLIPIHIAINTKIIVPTNYYAYKRFSVNAKCHFSREGISAMNYKYTFFNFFNYLDEIHNYIHIRIFNNFSFTLIKWTSFRNSCFLSFSPLHIYSLPRSLIHPRNKSHQTLQYSLPIFILFSSFSYSSREL